MKIFLDECVDWRRSRDLVGHEVKTARQMGWTAIKNGEFLILASQQSDIFITVDQNLSFQQNLTNVEIAVIVLEGKDKSARRFKDSRSEAIALASGHPPGHC